MKQVFMNMRAYFIVVLTGMIISYAYLRMMDVGNLATMYQTIFGGRPLNNTMLKGLFIMTLFLLQYVNSDYIIFYIDNSDSLSVRYGSRNNWLKALLKGFFMITAGFVLFMYFVWLLLDIVSNSAQGIQTIGIDTLGMIGRIYLFCTIIVLVQICLLMKTTKSNTYLIMCGISIVLAVTSHYRLFFNILPQFSSSSNISLNIIVNIVIFLLLMIMISRINHKKELLPNEN